MLSSIIKNRAWVAWLDACERIPYKAKEGSGIGNGEHRLASILGHKIEGQNSPYDFLYEAKECDVKQLDNGSFNSGVKGRDALRPHKDKIYTILIRMPIILEAGEKYLSDTLKAEIHALKNKSPDEMCEESLKSLEHTSKRLNILRSELETLLTFKEVSLPDGTKKMVRSDILYNVFSAFDNNEMQLRNEMGDTVFEHARLYNLLNHPYIVDPSKMMNGLNELIHIFKDTWLFFVDEDKGFYPAYDPCDMLRFQRITKGSPRFAVVNTPELYTKKEKGMSNADLKAECKQLGINGYLKCKNKKELLELLKNHKPQGAS